MIYNRTKKQLEKAAGIIGIVFGAFQCFYGIIMIMSYIASYYRYNDYFVMLVWGVILFIIATSNIIFSSLILTSPIGADGKVKNKKVIRIFALISNFCSGIIISFVLELVAIVLPDYIPMEHQTVMDYAHTGQTDVSKQQNSLDAKVAEIKRFKDLGIIDDETYKKAIEKVISDISNK